MCTIGGPALIQTIIKLFSRSCQHIGYNRSYCCNPLSLKCSYCLVTNFLQVHNVVDISLKIKNILVSCLGFVVAIQSAPLFQSFCLGIRRQRLHGRGCFCASERRSAEIKVILFFFNIILPWKHIKLLHVATNCSFFKNNRV